jgi:hypothetical protein
VAFRSWRERTRVRSLTVGRGSIYPFAVGGENDVLCFESGPNLLRSVRVDSLEVRWSVKLPEEPISIAADGDLIACAVGGPELVLVRGHQVVARERTIFGGGLAFVPVRGVTHLVTLVNGTLRGARRGETTFTELLCVGGKGDFLRGRGHNLLVSGGSGLLRVDSETLTATEVPGSEGAGWGLVGDEVVIWVGPDGHLRVHRRGAPSYTTLPGDVGTPWGITLDERLEEVLVYGNGPLRLFDLKRGPIWERPDPHWLQDASSCETGTSSARPTAGCSSSRGRSPSSTRTGRAFATDARPILDASCIHHAYETSI